MSEAVAIETVIISDLIEIGAWPSSRARVTARLAELARGGARVLQLGPQRWWVLALEGESLPQDLELTGDLAAVVELGASRKAFRVSGPAAPELLVSGLPLDLDPAVFRPGDLAQSAVHHVTLVLQREDDRDGAPSYLLVGLFTFAQSLEHWLHDAALAFEAA